MLKYCLGWANGVDLLPPRCIGYEFLCPILLELGGLSRLLSRAAQPFILPLTIAGKYATATFVRAERFMLQAAVGFCALRLTLCCCRNIPFSLQARKPDLILSCRSRPTPAFSSADYLFASLDSGTTASSQN